jgi:hypothetical protein
MIFLIYYYLKKISQALQFGRRQFSPVHTFTRPDSLSSFIILTFYQRLDISYSAYRAS